MILTLFMKRWTHALCGFAFFLLGAQHADEVNKFNCRRFEDFGELYSIPGMIGVVDGGARNVRQGFIGLSDHMADQNGEFTWNRGNFDAFRTRTI